MYSHGVLHHTHDAYVHNIFALRTALKISTIVVVFFSSLLSFVDITARPGLFLSLAYHRSGSWAVMLRA